MNNKTYPKRKDHNLVIQEFAEELLIYDLDKNKAYCLNETSAMIWRECDGTKSTREISQSISQKLKTEVSEDIVWIALNQLKIDNLLANNEQFFTPFDGLKRREIIKRIGISSIIVLPLISSVVAPTAAHAQSTACAFICVPPNNLNNVNPNGCPCAVNGDCTGDCNSGICINGTNTPICAPAGNLNNVSANCCPCATNGDCINDCVSGICAA